MSTDSPKHTSESESAVDERGSKMLLRSSPDPILVADTSSGEIVEANDAATELLGRPRDSLIGSRQVDLHPPESATQYRELFESHKKSEGRKESLPDGSPIHVLSADGDRIPVEINANRAELHDREVLVGSFRTIADRGANEPAPADPAERYESFFENNPLNIWEEDLSKLKTHLDSLAEEVDSLERYFQENPAAVRRALRKIEVIGVNQNAVDYYGASSKAELTASMGDLFTEEAYTKFIDLLLAVAEGETTVKIETNSRSLEGDQRSERIELYVPEAYQADYRRGYLITTDITERKARERELRSFKRAVENAGHAVIITDRDGAIEYVNPKFEEQSGYDAAEVLGENPRILKSGTHGNSYYSKLWETILDGGIWSAQIHNERKDGEQFVVDQTIAPIEDDEGEIQRFVAVNRDITERKERERELLELQQAVEYAGNSVYITDTDGTIQYANAAFESVTGYSEPEAVGSSHEEFRVDDRGSTPDGPREALLEGKEWEGEVLIERKSGERLMVEETVAPIEDESGHTRGFVGIQTDVTERKLREQQLVVFSRVFRHNLRNDGMAIKGRAQLLQELLTEDSAIEHAREIQENIDSLLEIGKKAHHARRTIATTLSRSERRRLDSALEQLTASLRERFPEASIDVEYDFDGSAEIDPRVIPSIDELLRNAIEHSEADTPAVRVTVDRQGTQGVIRIADNGPGIPATERDVIEAGTEEPLKHGSGLGLWLVYWLITFVGGEIAIEVDDGGSTVSVFVPLQEV
ncbi:MAG: PAS domain S-box protein [Halodesulfurarchaeum sp.]